MLIDCVLWEENLPANDWRGATPNVSKVRHFLGCVQHTHDVWWTRKDFSSLLLRSAYEK